VSSTAWVRVCTPPRQIAYKQLSQSPLLKAHVGRWIVTGTARGGAVVTSQHSCLIDRDATTSLLGRQSTVDDARTTVRRLLRGDSSAVLAAVRSRAERTGSRVGS
jgi:aromatase